MAPFFIYWIKRMGLFSSKKETVVGTSVVRVMDDKILPNAIRAGMVKGIFAKDGQMTNYILEEMLNGIAIKAERMYTYGKTKYEYGLPEMRVIGAGSAEGVVKQLLADQVGKPVTVSFFKYGAINLLQYSWYILQQQHGYNQVKNELEILSQEKGFPVYLEDIIIVVPVGELDSINPMSLDQWGVPANLGSTPNRNTYFESSALFKISAHTPIQISNDATEEYAIIQYTWNEVVTETLNNRTESRVVVHKEEMILPLPDMDNEASYIQTLYSYDSDEVLGLSGTGEFGQEETRYKPVYRYFIYKEKEGTYPEIDAIYDPSYEGLGSFFPRIYFRDDNASLTADKTTTGYKTSKKLTKYLGMEYQDLADAIAENPEVGGVYQAMIMMAVPGVSDDPVESTYLFDFFKKVYLECGVSGIDSSGSVSNGSSSILNSIGGFTGGGGISVVIQDARLGVALNMTNIRRTVKAGKIGDPGFCSSSAGTEYIQSSRLNQDYFVVEDVTVAVPYYYYKKQISKNTYELLSVGNLQTRYNVYRNYYTSSGETGSILLVPLDYSLTAHYNNRDRELLYSRSLHYVFNAVERIKVKWYQQDWFQAFVFIAAVVYMAFTMDFTAFQTLAGALEAIGVMVLTSKALQLFVKAVGLEAALILAAVFFMYGGYKFFTSGVQGAPWAQDLLRLAAGLAKAGADSITELMVGLKSEIEAFGYETAEKSKLLEEANELLWSENIFAPFILSNETPDQYFNRTIHSGNIGRQSIDAISDYVTQSLQLPKMEMPVFP